MSFSDSDQDNPQRVSAAVNTAGFAQDVVVATSRFIHGQALTEGDRRALTDCRELLSRLASTEITFARSGERRLAATNTVALLRQARATHSGARDDLTKTVKAIDRLLAGERDEQSVAEVRKLRDTFLALAEANLAAMTRRDPGQEGSDGWPPLIASSLS
jgi:hypothetical protein